MERFMDDDMLVEHGKDTTQMWVKYEDCVQEIALTKADAQATIAALQEKLTAALKVKADYDRWLSGGVYFTTAEYEKHAEDHRQREAALQARVQELEEWKRIVTGAGTDQESVIRLAATEYTKTAVQCWKEANARLASQLTQRTAELEAAKADKAKWEDIAGLRFAGDHKFVKEMELLKVENANLQAELERVRADIKALDKWRADVTMALQRPEGAFFVDVPQHIKDLVKERDDLRTLVAALPKVEGAVVVSHGYVKDSTRCHALFGADEDAASYAALLQHRQGMEG